jgi:PKD repeat protein
MKSMKKSAIIIVILTIFLSAIPAAQAASPPVASFTSTSPQSGTFILPMVFKDTSTNTPTSWVWTCKNLTPGNNTEIVFSTAQNPTFSFGVGTWSIKLKASNAVGYNITPGTFLVKVRTLKNIQVFPKDHIWNVRVDTLPVDPKSNTYINTMMENTQAHNYVEPQWGRAIRAEPNIFESPSEVTYYNLGTSVIVRTPIPHDPLYTENTNRGEYSCTADGDDCHAYIIDKTNLLAYELYHVNRNPENNSYTAKNVVVYDLSDYKLISPGTPTVEEAGLSMLDGFIYYDPMQHGLQQNLLMAIQEQMSGRQSGLILFTAMTPTPALGKDSG